MLLYGVATFGRECSAPVSQEPWADLKTLLHDCLEENVVLVVDGRYRTVEMLAALVLEHQNQITQGMFQRLEALIVGIVNTPHARVEVKTESGVGPNVDCGGRQVSDAILRDCPFPIDFEYAVPRAWACRATAGCVVSALGKAAGSVDQVGDEMPNASAVTCGHEVRMPEEDHPASQPTAASCCFVEKREADAAADVTVQPCDMEATRRDQSALGAGRVVDQVTCGLSSVEVSHAEELIWLGRYQESMAQERKTSLKRKQSFGAFKSLADLSQCLGRALRHSERLEILDAVFGKILCEVDTGRDLWNQSEGVVRFSISIWMFLELWKDCRVVRPRGPAVVRTFKHRSGPTNAQVRHWERMFKCLGQEVVVDVIRHWKRGGGGKAHSRYIYSTMAIVGIPDGCDVVELDERRRLDGSIERMNVRANTLRMAPEKAFEFAERSPHVVEEMDRYRVPRDDTAELAAR
jgi:hypothetical protein